MTTAEIANAYLDALCAADLLGVATMLHEEVIVDLPMSLTGEPVPMFTFDGKSAVMDYLGSITENFRQVRFNDRRIYAASDGRTVFVEATGDSVQRGTNASYRNTYCFKVTVSGSLVEHVSEYTNPIAWGKLMNLKLG